MISNTTGAPAPPANKRDHALIAARRGLSVFKLPGNAKKPPPEEFFNVATTDPDRVSDLWSEPVSGDACDNNIGIATDNLLAVDVDTKNGKPGEQSLQRLIDRGLDVGTLTSRTPSGGKHLFYSLPFGFQVANSGDKLGPGLDVRGYHGYVVAPGSTVDEREYRWVDPDAPILPAPDWLIAEAGAAKRREARDLKPLVELDQPTAVDAAIAYLVKEAPEAVENSGGDNTTIRVANRVIDFGLSVEGAFSVMSAHWNETKAFPSWDPDDLMTKVRNAWNSRKKRPGIHFPFDAVDEFDAVEISPDKAERPGVSLKDFYAYMPQHTYIYAPTRETWPTSSVNARVPPIPGAGTGADGKPKKAIPAATWLDQNQPVEQMTWAPGLPLIIRDRLIAGGGWFDRKGVSCFNLYRPPTIKPGNAQGAKPWIELVHRVFPDDAEHIIKWLAHRVQHPDTKINHALVLGGDQGIGKDTILEPVKRATGPWNFSEVSPKQMLGRFNGFLKSVILRVSEAHDLGEIDRFTFYDHLKTCTAAPPDVLRIDEKNLREYSIPNCVGVLITTNHKTDGIYLPADDRRNYVAWSNCKKTDFADSYWDGIYWWYDNGGDRDVAAYLAELDLSGFNPKAPPPKTPAFWEIVNANRAPEDAELADVLDRMGNPEATTIAEITIVANDDLWRWFKDPKNRRAIPHRLEKCGYVSTLNDAAQDGLWKINGKRQAVYAKKSLSLHDRLAAAQELVADGPARAAILAELYCE